MLKPLHCTAMIGAALLAQLVWPAHLLLRCCMHATHMHACCMHPPS